MRRRIISATLALGIFAASAFAVPATAHGKPQPPVPPEQQFVDTKGNDFTLGGKPFAVNGSNNYYPMYSSELMVDALFEKTAASGFNTMRVWGFFAIGSPDGGPMPSMGDSDKGVYFEYWDDAAGAPAYNDGPTGLEKLDYVVAKAKEEGVRLVLPLSNNWREFGGMDQYNTWAGNTYHSDFYTSEQTRGWYKDWVNHLLNRVNIYTGVAYKDEPAIMAWELANEPRCVGSGGVEGSWGNGPFFRDPACTADTLLPWVEEMSAYIKSIDSNHLVGTGDEGFFNDPTNPDFTYNGADGVDSLAFAKVSTIDYMSFHLYPDAWGGKSAEWGAQWIADHNKAASKIHKPALLGEYGWRDKATRNETYKLWLDTSLKTHGAGSLYWILSDIRDDGTLYPDYDGFTVYCPSAVCTTIQNYGQTLKHPWHKYFPPVADDDSVETPFATATSVNVVDNDIAYITRINVRSVDLDPATSGRQTTGADARGTWSVDDAGVVTVTPAATFAGNLDLTYTVRDRFGTKSNVATLRVVVQPDPNAALVLENFDADADGWVCGGGTVTSVGGEGVFANTSGGWTWCTIDFPAAVDLTGKTQVTVDFLGTDSGVNPEFVFKAGPGWEWCQKAPVTGGWNTPTTYVIDLSTLSASCIAGLNEVHGFGIGMQAGTHRFDNVVAN